jgi:hypothetical protein
MLEVLKFQALLAPLDINSSHIVARAILSWLTTPYLLNLPQLLNLLLLLQRLNRHKQD